MNATCPTTYWRVAWGDNPNAAAHIDYDDQWNAVAYYNVRRSVMVARYNESRDPAKRLECMEQEMSNHWNCRAVYDGREENVWLWRNQDRES